MATAKSKSPVVYSRIEINGPKGRQFIGYAEYRDEPPRYPYVGGILAAPDPVLEPKGEPNSHFSKTAKRRHSRA